MAHDDFADQTLDAAASYQKKATDLLQTARRELERQQSSGPALAEDPVPSGPPDPLSLRH